MPTYRDTPGTTTEWEDIQYKHGNKVGKYVTHEAEVLAAKMKDIEGDSFEDAPDPLQSVATKALHEQLEDDDEDEAVLQELRRRRLEMMQHTAAAMQFGSVRGPIARSDYIQEVTKAPKGVAVVLLLVEDGHSACGAVLRSLQALATRFPRTKFLTIRSTDAIPNFPAAQLPAVLIYRDGGMKRQITGPNTLGGLDSSPDKAEAILATLGCLPGSSFEPAVLQAARESGGGGESSGDEDEEDKYERGRVKGKTVMRF
eukprot:TRINITY_DN73526_c0_g1_i1.p2 TRINITY_DN73526_c0_g1~~TRINITY_DN73526_c0_g1_i1.p2  ORF type:complete len:257 (+),score=56.55 TRINITY_DN73526_c0_g1_i1:238-1008(+)